MKDAAFIEEMLLKGKEAGERVKKEFLGITVAQLNWKPDPESWSIGQCLDHLIVADCLYFPTFEKIALNSYKMTLWQKRSPFRGLFGKILASQMGETTKRKINTTRIFFPSHSQIDLGVFDRFEKHLDSLLEYIAFMKDTDLDKTYITSPAGKFITYSLRNTVLILIPHLHRHINQAIRVRSRPEFPK